MFERIWLKAAIEELAFQPLGSLPLFLTKYEDQGPEAFLPHHAERISKIRAEFDHVFPNLRKAVPVMAFRIGQAKTPSARSFRFPLELLINRS